MSDEERKALALRLAPGVRNTLGYIDIERRDSDEEWALVVVAVLEEMEPLA